MRSPWCKAETRAPLGKLLHRASRAEKPRAASGRRRTGRCRGYEARASRQHPPRLGKASLGRARLRKSHRKRGPKRGGGSFPPPRALRAARPVVRKETIKRPFLPHPGRGGRRRCREDNEQRPLPAPLSPAGPVAVSGHPAGPAPPRPAGASPPPPPLGPGSTAGTGQHGGEAGTARLAGGEPRAACLLGSHWPKRLVAPPRSFSPVGRLGRLSPALPPPLRGHLSLWRK